MRVIPVTEHCGIIINMYDSSFYAVYFSLIFGDDCMPSIELESPYIFDKGEAVAWCHELESRLFHESNV